MSKIILISCVSKKQNKPAKAKKLYISPLFKKNLEYAKSLNPNKIFILSAKYHLLELDELIEPYNTTLNNMKNIDIKNWAEKVLQQLEQKTDLTKDEFIFLAGERYRKFLIPKIKGYNVPMKSLGIGKQLSWLSNQIICNRLHQIFNNSENFTFPFDKIKIPKNGIYILFENFEKAHNKKRIVRIGTHTGKDQLPFRLCQHFLNENKDRSIFRKNIGRAILNKSKDPFLKYWELDLTTRKAKEKYSSSVNFEKQRQIEKQVTEYIQRNFSFAILPIKDKKRRLELESKIISTISSCSSCSPSEEWLGNFSPKSKIRKSGLWLVNELWKTPLSKKDLKEIEELV